MAVFSLFFSFTFFAIIFLHGSCVDDGLIKAPAARKVIAIVSIVFEDHTCDVASHSRMAMDVDGFILGDEAEVLAE